MSTSDILTTGISQADEQLPSVADLTAEDVYNAFDGGNDEAWADLLSEHIERTISTLRSTCTRLRLASDIVAVEDAIIHLEHFALELGYEAERDY